MYPYTWPFSKLLSAVRDAATSIEDPEQRIITIFKTSLSGLIIEELPEELRERYTKFSNRVAEGRRALEDLEDEDAQIILMDEAIDLLREIVDIFDELIEARSRYRNQQE